MLTVAPGATGLRSAFARPRAASALPASAYVYVESFAVRLALDLVERPAIGGVRLRRLALQRSDEQRSRKCVDSIGGDRETEGTGEGVEFAEAAGHRGPLGRARPISADANETCGAWLSRNTGCARRAVPMTKAGRRTSTETRKVMLESTIELLSFEDWVRTLQTAPIPDIP